MAKIEEVNRSNSGKKIPLGRVNTKLTVIDGSDGFSELKIISSRQERQFEDHGITMDFSIISVAVEHHVDTATDGANEGEEEAILSQAMSQSSLEDYSQSTQFSQSSQSQSSQSQYSQSQSSAASQSTSTERPVESTESSTEGGKYTVVYEEKNPNSPLVSRPIFR